MALAVLARLRVASIESGFSARQGLDVTDLTTIADDKKTLEALEKDGDLHTIWQLTEEDVTGLARMAYDRLCELPLFSTLFSKLNSDEISSLSSSSTLPKVTSNFGSSPSQYMEGLLLEEQQFVGRKKEMKAALNFVHTSRGLYIIYGSEGIGKSAMLEEIAGRLRCEDEEALVLTGTCLCSIDQSPRLLTPIPQLVLPLLTPPRLASPHLASLRLASLRLASLHFKSNSSYSTLRKGSGRFSESSTELFPFREVFAELLVRKENGDGNERD